MKMRLYLYLFVSLSLLILISCQQSLIKKNAITESVDSTLYFKQVDIKDPFFETLDQNEKQNFTIKKAIIPPPPPIPEKPKFKEIEGYRVQVFAGIDSLNAILSKSKVKNLVSDTIYFNKDQGLYKLQVGDFPYYPQADSIKRRLRLNGFPGAWIVQRKIHIPIIDSLAADTVNTNTLETGKYKIQVIATGDENKANQIVVELSNSLKVNAFFKKTGNLYKVYVGYFNDESIARDTLKKIREINYADAWLVY